MRLPRIAAATNWRYAVGEAILIVVGITLALTADSWFENLQERRYETLVLQQLKTGLESDLELFDDYLDALQQSERDLTKLLNHLRTGDPYSPEIELNFNAVVLWRGGVRMRMAPYEELTRKSHR